MKAAVYTRVSSDEQATSGHSLTSQEDLCRRYAKDNGLEVAAIYSDTLSGSLLDRPGLQAMLLAAEAGEVGAVVCHANDRLTRDRMHLGFVLERLMKADCELHFVNQGRLDFESPEARMMLGMLGEFASYWREKIRMNARLGKRRRALRGKVALNDVPPYGYSMDNGHLVIVEAEAEVVRRIFEAYTAPGSTSLEKVARLLQGTPTPSETGHGPAGFAKAHISGPGRWNTSMIKRILITPTYSGRWVYGMTRTRYDGERVKNGDTVDVDCPPIVTLATQERAIARLAENKKLRTGKAKRRDYLMAGFLRCGECGLVYSGMDTIHAGRHYPYYRCSGRLAKRSLDGVTRRCNNRTLKADWLEDQARMFLSAIANYPDFAASLAEQERARQASPRGERTEKLKVRLAGIAAKRAKYVAALGVVGAGKSGKDLGAQLAELDSEEARLARELRELESAPAVVELDSAWLQSFYSEVNEGMLSAAFGGKPAQTFPPNPGMNQYAIWLAEGHELPGAATDYARQLMREVGFQAVVRDGAIDFSANIPTGEGLTNVQASVLAFWTVGSDCRASKPSRKPQASAAHPGVSSRG